MSSILHQIVGYGVAAVSFLSLGIATNRDAASLPFASQVHAIPTPPKTTVFDQRTEGGHTLGRKITCATHTRILVRSEQSLQDLEKHYASHPVAAAAGEGMVKAKVNPASRAPGLLPRWHEHRADPSVFVVDFVSPGTPGSDFACSR